MVKKRKSMKQNRFLGIFLAGFMVLSVSYSSDLRGMAAFEDAFTDIEVDGERCLVDADGNVLKNVTDDEIEAMAKSFAEDADFTLENFAKEEAGGTSSTFLAKDSSLAKQFISENEDLITATREEAHKNLISGLKTSGLQEFNVLDTTRAMNDAAQKAVQDATKKLGNNVDEAISDFNKIKSNARLAAKYIKKLKGLSGDTSALESEINTAVKSGDRAALEKACLDVAKKDALSGLSQHLVEGEGITDDAINTALKSAIKNFDTQFATLDIDALKAETDGALLSKFKSGLADNLKSADADFSKNESLMQGKQYALLDKLKVLQKDVFTGFNEDLSIIKKRFSSAIESSPRLQGMADKFSGVGSGLKDMGKEITLKNAGALVKSVVMTLGMAVLFMIPNIVQSTFLAHKMREVELQTLASPIQYGNWVFQIPVSCFNLDNPSATIPIYVRLPVASTTQTVSATAGLAYKNSVSGPASDNTISRAIAGNAKRYHINEAQYYMYNPGIIVAYFNSYQDWGSVPLTSSQFTSGQVIDLTTGMIIDDSGEQISATGISGFDAYPLIEPSDWHPAPPQQPLSPEDVRKYLPLMLSKLNLAGDIVKYIDYISVGSGATGASSKVSASLQNLFDCSCMDAGSTTPCTPSSGTCMITNMLNQYSGGLSFNADGTVGSESAGIEGGVGTTPVAANPNLLGSVKPLSGWGSTGYADLINQKNFPGFTPQAGLDLHADATKNYNALGCWVYLSTNTPFAQAVAQNNIKNSVTGAYVDYIIFLDKNLVQVPLMVPVEKEHYVSGTTTLDYTTTALGLNPKIAYWTSIAAFDNTTGKALDLPGCADATSGLPIKYDLQGNPHPATGGDVNLAGVAVQNTAPGTCVISAAIADLQSNFYQESMNLAGQFRVHQQAMVNKLNNGPFNYGNVSLTPSAYNITVPGSSSSAPAQAVITLYEGSTCYGSSVSDLLVAWDTVQNMTATLPDVNATEFFSLITDIAYSVASDGSLVPSTTSANAAIPVGFGSAPLTQNASGVYSLNEQALSTYYVLDTFLEVDLLEGSYPLPTTGTPIPYVQLCNGEICSSTELSLSAYVAQQRDAWATAFDTTGQMQGITIGALTFSMPSQFSVTEAVANGAFIYNVTPSPSAALCQNDLFIIVKTSAPGLSVLLDPINAVIVNPATTSHYVLSLVTGFIFDMQGNQLTHASGAPRRISIPQATLTALAQPTAKTSADVSVPTPTVASTIYNTLTGSTVFDLSTMAPGFEAVYQSYVTQYQDQMKRPMGPYSFGNFSLGILTGDEAVGNFVYFTPCGGMHDMATFEPADFLITYDGTANPAAWTSSTTQMMSIISGNLYDNNGNILNTLPEAEILSATATLEPMWSSWLKGKVKKLQAAMTAQVAAAAAEQAKLEALENAIVAQPALNLDQATASTMINGLLPGGIQGLPAPYGLLQYYPLSGGKFVHVSPASATEATQIYLFFDAGPDRATVADPTPVALGGIYTAAGNLQTILKGVSLQVIKDQYGVVVNADGTQRLALPLLQPSFIMQDSTEPLTFGSDSSNGDLICSTSATFPGGPVVMPKGYYLYYSMTMQAYYVWDSKRSRWISVVVDNQGRGHVYAQDGSPIKWTGKVAFSTSSSASADGIAVADDMILLYENQSGNMQGYMSNGKNYLNLAQSGSPMTWTPLKGSTALNVTVSSDGTKYTIGSTVYKVNASKTASKWYALSCVPSQADMFDSSGNVRTAPIKAAYQNAQLVMNGSTPTHLLFNGTMYKASTNTDALNYKMVPVDSTKKGTVTIALGGTDPDTKAPYVTVTDASKNTYTYIYAFDSIPASQFDAVSSIFAGTTATATRAFAVGATDVTTTTTNILFAKNIPTNSAGSLALTALVPTSKPVLNVPVQGDAAYTGFNSAVFYENIAQINKSTDGRYFAQLQPWTGAPQNNVLSFASAANGAYVDLHTGILYDTTYGISLGYSLALNDLLTVLNYYQVSMAYGKLTPKSELTLNLVYRTPVAISTESALFANRVNATT